MSPMRLALFLALRQLRERKVLNAVAVAGVTLGVFVLVVMSNVTRDFEKRFESEMLRVSPHVTLYARTPTARPRLATGYAPATGLAQVAHDPRASRVVPIQRPRELTRQLGAMPGVEAACMTVVGQTVAVAGSTQLAAEVHGVVPDEQERCTHLAASVDHGSWSELARAADGAVLGSRLASELGASVGDHLRLVSDGGAIESVRLVGILHTGVLPVDRWQMYLNLPLAQRVLGRGDQIDRIEVRLRDGRRSRTTAATIERVTGYDADSWQEASANYFALLALQSMIVQLMIGAILTVSGFGILAVQIMLVLQKTRDISILRSIGLRRTDILASFLFQGILISTLGAMLGDLLAWRAVEFLTTLQVSSGGMVESNTFIVQRSPEFYPWGAVFALVTGTLASLLPAWRASRVEPVDVLRGQVG